MADGLLYLKQFNTNYLVQRVNADQFNIFECVHGERGGLIVSYSKSIPQEHSVEIDQLINQARAMEGIWFAAEIKAEKLRKKILLGAASASAVAAAAYLVRLIA